MLRYLILILALCSVAMSASYRRGKGNRRRKPSNKIYCSPGFKPANGDVDIFCFKVHHEKLTWEEARAVCVEEGDSLVEIRDLKASKRVAKRLRNGNNYWTGVKRSDDGEFEFSEYMDDLGDFQPWAKGKPNNNDCVQMNKKGRWRDQNCQKKLGFVCQEAAAMAKK